MRMSPLPLIDAPTAESLDADPEEDPKEYEDDETEDGPVDYPIEGGDDGDGDDDESSGDDANDEDEAEEDDDGEEQEHLALADLAIVILTVELASPPERTEPVIPPPSTDTTTTGAKIIDEDEEDEEDEEEHLALADSDLVITTDELISPPERIEHAEVERLLGMPTPSASPLALLSPPSVEERLARCTTPTALPSPPFPPPLHTPPPVDNRDDIAETEMPPRKSLGKPKPVPVSQTENPPFTLVRFDLVIPLGQKNTLAEYMILSGVDNRPPMLDKDLYDSWKIQMELYMQNKEHGRMILESIENGPLIWLTIEENRVTKTKKYAELSAAKKIQADCDLKATNIILQGLSADIYSLVNHHKVYKDLCLPPEWSKFVTDVKLVKDLDTTNIDQLHAFFIQHELHANEVPFLRERNQDPLAFVANQQMAPPHFNTYQSSYKNP
uniref:Uncharacterized protein n=1 Tax=Tanacetum cinerariifolium TaxID=118510 RepID=A0A6L2NF13_TANCI|nr:hypothetical protein [Tanacetum cinerariifolium]